MKYFIDNCISPYVAAAINLINYGDSREEYDVVHLREKFNPATDDHIWLKTLGEEGDWAIISGDPRITRGKIERAAWQESGITGFFLGKGWGSLPLWDHTWRLFKWWPTLRDEALKAKSGTGFIVPVTGGQLDIVRR